MMQEIENFKGKWIVYGIGNSIFNAPGRYNFYNAKPYSFIAELIIKKEMDTLKKYLRLYPIYTDNLSTDYQIRFLDSDEFIDCYKVMKEKNVDVNEINLKDCSYSNYFELEIK